MDSGGEDIMEPIVAAFWGHEKTSKSTISLTFPKPLIHFELDVGGFRRATSRPGTKLDGITSTPYAAPLPIDKLMGKITVRATTKVVGMKELWQKIMLDYANAVQKPEVATIVIDSGTRLWEICHTALLQEKQEEQLDKGVPEDKLRTQLLAIEYGPANNRMKILLDAARTFRKNLVLTHYPKDVYADKLTERGVESYKTGEVDVDGFKQTKALSDIVIYTSQRQVNGTAKMFAKITLSGLGLSIQNMEVEDFSYEKLEKLIKMSRGES
jgi:hypothetical protein